MRSSPTSLTPASRHPPTSLTPASRQPPTSLTPASRQHTVASREALPSASKCRRKSSAIIRGHWFIIRKVVH